MEAMQYKRPWWHRILRAAFILLALLIVAVASGAWWLLGTSSGARWTLGTALPYAQQAMPDNFKLDIQGINADTLASIRLASLRLSDADGLWLEATDITLRWSPRALFKKRIEVQSLAMERLHFIRPPLSGTPTAPSLREQVASLRHMLETLPQTLHGTLLPPLHITSLRIADIAADMLQTAVPSRFHLEGHLDLTTLPAQIDLQLDSIAGVATRAAFELRGNLQTAALALSWREEAGGLLGNMAMLQSSAPLYLSANASMEDGLLQSTLTAQAAQTALLDGEVDLPLASAEPLKLHVTLPHPDLLQPLHAITAPLELTATLSDTALHTTAALDHYPLGEGAQALSRLQFDANLAFDTSPDYVFTATAQAQLQQATEQEPLPIQLTLSAEGDENSWNIDSFKASAKDIFALSSQGTIGLEDGDAEFEGTATLPQLTAHFTATGKTLWQQPDARMQVILDTLNQPLPAPLDKVLSLPVTLTAQTQETDGTALPPLTLTLEAAHLNGTGMLYPSAQQQQILATADITIGGLPVPLTLTASHHADSSGHIEARSQTLLASTDYQLHDGEVALSDLSLLSGDALKLEGALRFDTAQNIATGNLAGHIRSTAPLHDLGIATPDIRLAKGTLDLKLTAPAQTQTVTLKADTGAITLDAQPLASSARLDASVRLAEGAPQLNAKLRASSIARPLALQSTTLTAQGNADTLDWSMDIAQDANHRLQGSGTLQASQPLVLTFKKLALNWPENRFSLTRPASLHYATERLRLEPLAFTLNDKPVLQMNAQAEPDAVNGTLKITQLPLRALPMLASVAGTLDGNLQLSGTPANPKADWRFDMNDLQHNYPEMTSLNQQPLAVTLRGGLSEQTLTAQLSTNAPDAESFAAANLTLPVNISLPPAPLRIAANGSMDAALRADLQLAPFLPLALPDGVYGAGHLLADMTLKGTASEPVLNGDITLSDGQIEILQAGTLINELGVSIEARGKDITIRDGSATDGDKGRLAFNGTVNISPQMPMDISTSFTRFVALRHPNATATLSGEQQLSGDLSNALLKGKLHIDSARITIEKSNESAVVELPVTEVPSLDAPLADREPSDHVTDTEKKAAREQRKRNRPFARNLALDVTIGADNQIFLDGLGLNAELKGKVALTGTAARPEISGKMSTVRGRWEFFGRTFVITRGEALLSQNNLSAPLINIRAESNADDILAIAQITGSTNSPKIDLSSIPALPKDEVLSRVMFGQNLNNISPFQAVQLADMLRSLSGSGGGGSLNPLSALQSTLGIDELKINNNSGNTQDTTVGVGKYVQENIYLQVEGGASENSGKVSLEVDLTPNISVETEARQNAESAVRLNYKYDY
jgi:autotransporter translocation and assembly factor TamB